MSLSASLLQKINMLMNRLCEIALNKKLLHKCEEWWKFSSLIKAKLCNIKSLTISPACMQKYGFASSPSAFQFQPHGKCIGRRGHLASLSNIFWFNVVCTSHFSLQMAKVQATNHSHVLICMNLGVTYFLWPHCVCHDLSKHHSAPVSLCMLYSAG